MSAPVLQVDSVRVRSAEVLYWMVFLLQGWQGRICGVIGAESS